MSQMLGPVVRDDLLLMVIYLAGWLVVYALARLLKSERYGLSSTPLYLMFRTKVFNRLLESISLKHQLFWRIFWNAGILVGIGLMVYIIYQLIVNSFNFLYQTEKAASIQPILPLPGVTITWETFPYLILAISIVLLTHEAAHGIASLIDGVPLKSTGAFFALIVFGGFVEPDEDKLNGSPSSTKLRVFAAGSFVNLVLGLFFLFLLANFTTTITPFYSTVTSGVAIGGLIDGSPAQEAGITPGDVLKVINGTHITSVSNLRGYMSAVGPGKVLRISTQRGEFVLTTKRSMENASQGLIGISGLSDKIAYVPKFPILPSTLPLHVLKSEFWLAIVLLSVALINMLPLYPFDGDKYLDTLLNHFGVKKSKAIRTVASTFCLGLLGLNFALSFITFGFVRF